MSNLLQNLLHVSLYLYVNSVQLPVHKVLHSSKQNRPLPIRKSFVHNRYQGKLQTKPLFCCYLTDSGRWKVLRLPSIELLKQHKFRKIHISLQLWWSHTGHSIWTLNVSFANRFKREIVSYNACCSQFDCGSNTTPIDDKIIFTNFK